MIRSLESEAKSIKKKNKTPLFILASRKKKPSKKQNSREGRHDRKGRDDRWKTIALYIRRGQFTALKRGNRPPFLSRPIFIQLVSRGQSISPITSSRSWHVPHPRHAGSTPKGAPPHPLPPPPLSPYLNLIFPQSALKALFLQKDTSFLSLFRLFLPSSNLFPLIHFEKKFSCFDPHPFFLIFFFRMLEKKFFCFEFHYSKRYRRARDLPRVFKKTVTSRWAPPSRSESKSIEFERFRSKTCSTQIKSRELLYSLMRATARTSERSFSSEARRNIKLFFYKPRNTISIVSIKRFGLRRRRQQSSLGIVSPWPRFFEKNEKLEIKKGILRNVFFLINSNVIRGKDSSFQNEEKEQRDSIPEILFNETKYISLIVLLTTPSIRV